MKPPVLVTKRIYPEAIEYLKEHCEVDYVASDGGLTAVELRERVRGKQAIVSQLTDKFTTEVIGALEGVRIIANVAVGFDNIDIPAATRRGILVSNTPDVLTETTADFAFALLMAAARRVVEGHQFVRSGQWRLWAIDLLVGHDVHDRTLGIFGMGRIGRAVAQRARGFSMRILYHDAVRAPEAVERELSLEFAPKETLLRESDFVSLHVPLLDSTRRLIGASELRLMKPTAILVNTSRGPVVDEGARAGGGRGSAGRSAGAAHHRGRRTGRVRIRAARPPQAARAQQCGAGAAHRQRFGGHAPAHVDDGRGKCSGRAGEQAAAQPG